MKQLSRAKKYLLLAMIISLLIVSVIVFRYLAEIHSLIYILCAIACVFAYPLSLWYPNRKR